MIRLTLEQTTGTLIGVLAIGMFLSVPMLDAQVGQITGNIHPLAQSANDQGPVNPSMELSHISIFMKRSVAQQADLDELLIQQQDPTSPLFHQWITPEQFADRFGSEQNHIDEVTHWLQTSGFSIVQVARGRDFVVFKGTSGQVDSVFNTSLHRFSVDGEMHFANSSEPSVPEELAPFIAGFTGLHDFKFKPPKHRSSFQPIGAADTKVNASFVFKANPGVNLLAPDDLATIYNVNPLYKMGIDGSGQIIAIAGASDINLTDIQAFRAFFNLPFNNPYKILVPNRDDPGIDNEAMVEADLDLEWSGAIARNATIRYVYSADPFDAAIYTIDEKLASVLSFSFSVCELRTTPSLATLIAAYAQQAAVEGITWVASSGDNGAAGCEAGVSFPFAITRMVPNFPASLPYVTAVGGSEFNEGTGNYWSGTLGPNLGSVLGYIPERAWNDITFDAQQNILAYASSGGGSSWIYSKPNWQSAPGVPNDGARDVPDVSLTASSAHDPYAVLTGGHFAAIGGTSGSAPAFAGMVALVNQYLATTGTLNHAPGLGLINPMLYSLSQSSPDAFHAIITGSNIVPCIVRSTQDCMTGFMGYQAGPGYNLVTGLGSVDLYNLALDWRAAVSKTARLAMTQITTTTSVRVGGTFSVSMTMTNEGTLNAGAFRSSIFFTSDGTIATAKPFYIYCDVKGLAAGASYTCSGTTTLDSSITQGTYLMVAIADVNKAVPQVDRAATVALATSGPVTVTP